MIKMENINTKAENLKYTLRFWDEYDSEVDSFEFKFYEVHSAIDFVLSVASCPELYPDYYGWSITNEEGYWVVEKGEDHIPLKKEGVC